MTNIDTCDIFRANTKTIGHRVDTHPVHIADKTKTARFGVTGEQIPQISPSDITGNHSGHTRVNATKYKFSGISLQR